VLAGRVLAAVGAMVVATMALEIVLLPITASWFNVATAAGVIANVVAVPAMAVVQIAGLLVVATAWLWPWVGDVAGVVAAQAVAMLLRSADVVALAPWLVREVPPPSPTTLVTYYSSLAVIVAARSRGRPAIAACGYPVLVASLAWMVAGGRDGSAPAPWTWPGADAWQRASWPREPWLIVTMLDVGQGDATVLRFPSGDTWLVDAGGSMSETFDVGERVTSLALWALGHRSLARVLVTHAHPDHAGGVPAVLRRLDVRELLTGIPVPGDVSEAAMLAAARARGVRERRLLAGESLGDRLVRVHVVHPDAPDWERRRVRNDDSIVIWVRFGDVGLQLTGDVGESAERAWADRVAAAPLTILKLAHHGSASSTGATLLARARPALALGSMGRGNAFGHPAPAVLSRLRDAGVVLLRTDEVGAIQLATNGRVVLVRTASGLAGSLTTWEARHAWRPATPPPSDRASPRRLAAHPPRGAPPWP
jgi:competence protein ComEC